ncbi:MAG: phosphoenolpyruvate carboxykinase (ATP) [Phycisphaerales bacterium]|nr:phosphoenolpyruvate carboxykinase (ATP) [Phycisphaerales bacterium]
MPTLTAFPSELTGVKVHLNLSPAQLIEEAIRRGEGVLASNGALNCMTGERTGRSPNDKFLEDTPRIHDAIWWGKVNRPITPENFEELLGRAIDYLQQREEVFEFRGSAGADEANRLFVRVITEQAWHSLFARTLFIPPADDRQAASIRADWTIINVCNMDVPDWKSLGLSGPVGVLQSLERKIVVIFGTHYAGEIKKSIFYAMNYDLPERGVFPMHCSANVSAKDPTNVALFFGLSGTGKTTLSADPGRRLIGDDEHGWSKRGVFNFEGGCYAKCIRLSQEGEPQIWNAIRFGSVLENVALNDRREPDYDDGSITENTRVTYPVQFIPNAKIPSVAGHPKNVIFLTADAFGVLPPVSRLTREQAMYYFVNGYTSKLAGTEAGVTEPQPNFSPCFGGPFLPRPPRVYADMLAERIDEHDADVWLLNTGWSGGPYGIGRRFNLTFTRAMVSAILDGSLAAARFAPDPVFGLLIPHEVAGVPNDMLHPRQMWGDKAAYDLKAKELAARFRENDAKYDLPAEVRAAGPRG